MDSDASEMSACSRHFAKVGNFGNLAAVKHVTKVEDGGQVEERRGLDRLHPERAQRDLEWPPQGDRKTPIKMLR